MHIFSYSVFVLLFVIFVFAENYDFSPKITKARIHSVYSIIKKYEYIILYIYVGVCIMRSKKKNINVISQRKKKHNKNNGENDDNDNGNIVKKKNTN